MNEVQLVITLKPTGVEVSGPIGDKVLCYGLLESAKDAIRDFKPPAGGLTIPTMIPTRLNGLRDGN